jgi:hypothetical protein
MNQIDARELEKSVTRKSLTERFVRLMLYYHICRVQLESTGENLTPEKIRLMRQSSADARLTGFRLLLELPQIGILLPGYNDTALRLEGIKIAYEIRRGEVERAHAREQTFIAAMVAETLGDPFVPQISKLRAAA